MNRLEIVIAFGIFVFVCNGVISLNPCLDYVFLYNADGLRSSDFDSGNSETSICDAFLDPATWYRVEHDAGNRLIERPVEPWRCGTQAPIWMNGTHPTDRSEVTAKVCATYSSENICGWNGTVRIRLCNESGNEYFVYLLDVPPGCPLAYCIDAASRKQCIPPEVWLQDGFRCGVSETTTRHSTIPLTKLTTIATTSSSFTERQSLVPTLPLSTERESSGWSICGPWSVCSKQCDYGFQSCRRTCGRLPCEGPGITHQLCNTYKCQSLPKEKNRGIQLFFQSSSLKGNTMLTVMMNQQKIHDIIRRNINDICAQNVSICCGSQCNGISPLEQEFVLSSDIYLAQGTIELRASNTVYYQAIAIVNENIDREICQVHTERNYPSQFESSPNFLSFDVMLMAYVRSVDSIYKETGLIMTANGDHATMTEATVHQEPLCPSLTCVLPIVLCSSIIALVIVVGAFCIAKSKLKPRTEPRVPSPEPPNYYEVLSPDLRINIQGPPFSAKDIDHYENDKALY